MKRCVILLLFLMLLIFNNLSLGCTIIMVARDEAVLFGNNEDYTHPFTRIWFIPATNKTHGRVCLGFDEHLDFPFCQGGMNDQGLCIDGNGLAPTGWKPNKDLPDYDTSGPLWGNLCDYLLAHCATVEEVLEFFKNNNIDYLSHVKFPVADITGATAIIEWGQGKLQLIKRTGDYQISTNFVSSNYESGNYPCKRYKIAELMLKSADKYSIDLIRSILSATHVEAHIGSSVTLYSNIFDMKNGNIYLYNFHNFENVIELNLEDELKKGKKSYSITTLFHNPTYAQLNYLEGALLWNLKQYKNSEESEKVYYEHYKMLKHLFRNNFNSNIMISEESLNNYGYQLLRAKDVESAVEIFKINIAEHPDSWNAYDSLGEAYMTYGEKKLAIEHYRKSIELNPNNDNAKKMVEKLKTKKKNSE